MTLVQKEVKKVYLGSTQVRPAIVERPDITTAISDNKSLSVTKQGELQGLCLSKNGVYLYYCDFGQKNIYQYTLSTPRDITTGIYSGKYTVGDTCSGIAISDDGQYIYYSSSNNNVYRYILSTPYNITTATLSQTLSISGNITGIRFSDDGKILYYMNYSESRIYEYSLPTAWSFTNATQVGYHSYPVSGNTYRCCAISTLGGKIFMVRQSSTSYIYQMDMSTNYNITTASYDSKYTTIGYNACGIYVKPDGTKMYIGNISSGVITQYSLG